MIQWQRSEDRLNGQIRMLRGDRISFHIHYWGAVRHMFPNVEHKHSFYEICYVDGGTGSYFEGDKIYPLYEGVMFCSKPGIVHQIGDVNELDLLFVAFEPDDSLTVPGELAGYLNSLDRGAVWIENQSFAPVTQLWKSLLIPDAAANPLSSELLPTLAHTLLASYPDVFGRDRSTIRTHVRADASFLLRRAKRYIRDNLAGDLSLPEIARHLSVSERHLSRLFAEYIQESFTATVRSERIRAAEELLIHTMTPIKDIAEQVGFSSVHYFTRLFTQIKGEPPARYREANRRHADETH